MRNVARFLIVCWLLMVSTQGVLAATEMTGSLSERAYTISDTDQMYLTIVGPKDNSQYREVCARFDSTPELAAIKDTAHFHRLETGSKMYEARYTRDYREFPTVRVQTADGTIVKEWCGKNIPDSATLSRELQCLPRWRPQPQPPKPPAPVVPAPTPAPAPRPAPIPGMSSWVVVVVGLGLGLVLAQVYELARKQ